MPNLDWESWGLIALVIAGSVVAMLYTLSATIRDYQRAQGLRNEVERLRRQHAERLAALRLQAELDAAAKKAA